ncbi:hypothetical protein EJ110_NYTH11286 [Nymphaea thermarum]|nr:hypothetical protein EJ110_NYTH11286 [Nymphaea thermarum]
MVGSSENFRRPTATSGRRQQQPATDRTAPPALDPVFLSSPPPLSLPPNCLSPPSLVLDLILLAFFLVLVVCARLRPRFLPPSSWIPCFVLLPVQRSLRRLPRLEASLLQSEAGLA